MKNWLKRVFVPQENPDDGDADLPELDDGESFLASQHLRIVLAIVFTLLSALVIWWILA